MLKFYNFSSFFLQNVVLVIYFLSSDTSMIIFLCLGLIRSGIEGMEEQEQKYNTDNHIQVKQYQPFIGIYSRLTGNINNYNHPT